MIKKYNKQRRQEGLSEDDLSNEYEEDDNIDDLKILDKTKHEVIDLCKKFPIYT